MAAWLSGILDVRQYLFATLWRKLGDLGRPTGDSRQTFSGEQFLGFSDPSAEVVGAAFGVGYREDDHFLIP